MRTTLLSHPRLSVSRRTGSEGPRHDPYHYSEVTVNTPEHKVVLHDGLGTWAEVDGERTYGPQRHGDIWLDGVCEQAVGYGLSQILRFSRRLKSRCRMGGHHDTYSVSGYPGEHFEMCRKCGKMADSYFDESAVI